MTEQQLKDEIRRLDGLHPFAKDISWHQRRTALAEELARRAASPTEGE